MTDPSILDEQNLHHPQGSIAVGDQFPSRKLPDHIAEKLSQFAQSILDKSFLKKWKQRFLFLLIDRLGLYSSINIVVEKASLNYLSPTEHEEPGDAASFPGKRKTETCLLRNKRFHIV